MKKSTLLKKVRSRFADLPSNRPHFICWVLEDVSRNTDQVRELKTWIRTLLNSECGLGAALVYQRGRPRCGAIETLEDWVRLTHPKVYRQMTVPEKWDKEAWKAWTMRPSSMYVRSTNNFRALRILWLDWMIAYWEEKGE